MIGLVAALALFLMWVLGLLASRVDAGSRNEALMVDPRELQRLREQAEARRPAQSAARDAPPRPARNDRRRTPPAMTVLSVNVNKIAVLRNSRGGDAPDVARRRAPLDAGAHGITVHRARMRATSATRTLALSGAVPRTRGSNSTSRAIRSRRRGRAIPASSLCEQARPAQATLVPDGDG